MSHVPAPENLGQLGVVQSAELDLVASTVFPLDFSSAPGSRVQIGVIGAGTVRVVFGQGSAPADPAVPTTPEASGQLMAGSAAAEFWSFDFNEPVTHLKAISAASPNLIVTVYA